MSDSLLKTLAKLARRNLSSADETRIGEYHKGKAHAFTLAALFILRDLNWDEGVRIESDPDWINKTLNIVENLA